MMINKLLVIAVCAFMVTGCFSRSVEKTETISPERVIVHEHPEREVIIHERDMDNRGVVREQKKTTVIERTY